jgi:hypothetical protein
MLPHKTITQHASNYTVIHHIHSASGVDAEINPYMH